MSDHHHPVHSDHSAHGAAGGHHIAFDSPEMAASAELEGEVLVGFVEQGASRVAALCRQGGVEVGRVIDVGCGPGVGTCCLAARFSTAQVVAVDGSATMLEHVVARAERLGLTNRVETASVELPAGLEALGPAEVVWASMVLHHVGDEVAALRRFRASLAPGGLLALVERAEPVRVLLDGVDLGRPGIWQRIDEAWATWFAGMRADLPGATASADYPTMLAEAGFEPLVDEVMTVDLDAPLDAGARRFARQQLQRARAQLAARADGYDDDSDAGAAADLAVLDALIDESSANGILRRDDARLGASRHLFVARNPA